MATSVSPGEVEPHEGHDLGRTFRPRVSFFCISDISGLLMQRAYSALGRAISKHPKSYISLGVAVYLLFVPGLMLIKGDQRLVVVNLNTDFFQQFTFQGTQYYKEYMHATSLFPEARNNLLIFSSNEGSLGSVEFLRAAVRMEHKVLAQVVEHEGRQRGYEDLCHRAQAGGPCSHASLVSLLVPDPGVLDSLAGATPADVMKSLVEAVPFFSRFMLPLVVGSSAVPYPGVAANATQLGKWLAGARSGLSTFSLRPGDDSKQFELKIGEILGDMHREEEGPLRLTGYLEATISSESAEVLTSVLWLEALAVVLMIAYAITFLATQTRLPDQSQILVVAVSALVPAVSSIAGIGSLGYMGLPLNILGLTAPFLVLAQGVDSLFVIVSAVKLMGPEVDTPTAISGGLAKGGAASTITAFTSVCAFGMAWLGTLDFVGISSFNYVLTASIALSNFGMLVIVPSLLALGERRMLNGRMDLLPWRPQPKAVGPLVKILQQADPGPLLRKFMTHTYAPLPEQSRIFVGTGILLFAALLVLGFAGFSRVGSGMPDAHFFKDSSYVQSFSAELESQFGDATPIKMGLLLEQPAVDDPAYSTGLSGLLSEFDARPDVFMVDCSTLYLHEPKLVDGYGHCSAIVRQPMDPVARAAQAKELLTLVARGGVPAVLYHKSFPMHVTRIEKVRQAILETVAWSLVAVLGALLLAFPVHMALVAALNVCCILLTLFGFMGFTGVTFCSNTFVACIMAVGFCVDYTCHVVHAAMHDRRPGVPWASRMRHSLEACGYDVLHGCITAMLGIALLALAGSVAFRVCTLTILMITAIGGTYALVTLPALLSVAMLFGRPACQCEEAGAAASSPGNSNLPPLEQPV